MYTDAGMDGLLSGNAKKSQELLKEAGYDGTPIVLMASTDLPILTNLSPVAKQQLERGGFKVDMQSMDWQTLVARRSKKEPPAQGGWNIFITGTTVLTSSNPITHTSIGMGCDKAWFGWPCDAEVETLRNSWALGADVAARKQIAVEVSKAAYQKVPYISFGQWTSPVAYRSDKISGVLSVPSVPPMWNIEKK